MSLRNSQESQGADPGYDGQVWLKKGVQLHLWLQQSLIDDISRYGLSWATLVSEHLQSVMGLLELLSQGDSALIKSSAFFINWQKQLMVLKHCFI